MSQTGNTQEIIGLTIRFPSEVINQLRDLAADEGRSMNSEVIYLVQKYAEAKRKRANNFVAPEIKELVS